MLETSELREQSDKLKRVIVSGIETAQNLPMGVFPFGTYFESTLCSGREHRES